MGNNLQKLSLAAFIFLSGQLNTVAQDAANFFNNELVINGSAEIIDSNRELVGWIKSEGSELSITAKTYSNASFSNSFIPEGENESSWLFCGKGNGIFSSEGSSSYQIIEIPSDATEYIDKGITKAYMSALIGGYESQNDNITINYYFYNNSENIIKTTKLGPVYADERNNQTKLIKKSESLTVPSGTRKIKIEIIAEEKNVGSDVDGYADNISLIIKKEVKNPSITLNKSVFEYEENVSIDYSTLPDKAQINIYKNRAILPIKEHLVVEGDAFENNGTFNIGNTCEPGDYNIICTDENKQQIAPTIFFTVKEKNIEYKNKNIFILSDIHVMNPELLVKEGNAFDEYLATDRKLLQESEDILATMVDSILSRKPELVLIPGDLTKDGELISHELVISYLNIIKDAGIKVLVVPGNHDVNNPHALIYNGDIKEYAETISMEDFAELYKDFGYNSEIRDENSLSYVAEPYNNLVVIGIDACRYEDNTFIEQGAEKDVCVTDGRIKPETLEWICEQAKKANSQGKQVIAIMHHNLVEHFNMQASIAAPYVVADAENIRKAFMESGIHTVFTGHFHISDIAKDYNENKTDSIYDISTGSTVTYPCPFREVKLNENNTVMEINSHILKKLPGNDDNDINFDLYAKEKLANGIAPMVKGLITDYWDYINHTLDSIEGTLPMPGIIIRPETPEELGNLVIECFEEPGIKTYLTFSESNEHLKETSNVIEEVKKGIDKAIESLFIPLAQSIAKETIEKEFYPMIETILNSILENTTHKNTANENISNDLYLAINLPEQTNSSNITNSIVENDMINVYPTITDGLIKITGENRIEDSSIIIFDNNGHILMQEKIIKGNDLDIEYYFEQSGIYFVKILGSKSTYKVIVK